MPLSLVKKERKPECGKMISKTEFLNFWVSFRKKFLSSLREKFPYSELLWSAFYDIRTKYGKMRTSITLNMGTFYAVLTIKKSRHIWSKKGDLISFFPQFYVCCSKILKWSVDQCIMKYDGRGVFWNFEIFESEEFLTHGLYSVKSTNKVFHRKKIWLRITWDCCLSESEIRKFF